MAVPIEAYTLILLNDRLDRYLPGGSAALPKMAPATCLPDKHLTAVSFMVEGDAVQFLHELVQNCPDTSANALDGVIVSGNRELPVRDWLQFADWDGSTIVWKTGEDPNPLIAPEGWAPGKSTVTYCTQDDLEGMEYLGCENGVGTYRDRETGEKRYVGRPKLAAERLFEEAKGLIAPYLEYKGGSPPKSKTGEREAALQKGVELLETALATDPKAWWAHWHLGKAYQALGENEPSYQAFESAYHLEKSNPDVAREFMLGCLEVGKLDRAVEAAKHAAQLAPEDDGLISNLALSYLFAGHHKEALVVAKQAYKMKKDPITKNLIGYIKDVTKGRRPQPRKFSDL